MLWLVEEICERTATLRDLSCSSLVPSTSHRNFSSNSTTHQRKNCVIHSNFDTSTQFSRRCRFGDKLSSSQALIEFWRLVACYMCLVKKPSSLFRMFSAIQSTKLPPHRAAAHRGWVACSFLCWLCFVDLFKNSKDKKTFHKHFQWKGRKTFDFFVCCCGNICRRRKEQARILRFSFFSCVNLCQVVTEENLFRFPLESLLLFVFKFFPLINY